jgi:hypothetical protein
MFIFGIIGAWSAGCIKIPTKLTSGLQKETVQRAGNPTEFIFD